jgi:hypothetical protein
MIDDPTYQSELSSPITSGWPTNSSSQKPRMEFARQEKLRPPHLKGSASVLANPSDEECDVVLLFVWIELANVGDNRVNQS